MKKVKKNKQAREPFNIQKWMERETANDRIVPNDYFPDLDNHPFFKRKLEEARDFITKHPLPS